MPLRKAAALNQQALELAKRAHGKAIHNAPFLPGPNPQLPDFIRAYSRSYDPSTDQYDVPAFDRDLVVDKATPPKFIYDMHQYWSKKHWAAIREYIRHYLPERQYVRGTGLVLDCFAGSGMTGVAAMMEDRPCVLIDASPAAAYISHNYVHPVDPEELSDAYERLLTAPYTAELRQILKATTGVTIGDLRSEIDWLYATKCDRCGGDARTEYLVYSARFQCPNCAEVVALFDCPQERVPYVAGSGRSGKTELKRRTVCPHCLARNGGKPHRDFVISTRSKSFGAAPVLVSYRCISGCKPSSSTRRHDDKRSSRKGKFFAQFDMSKVDQIEAAAIPHWYPNRKMMDVSDDTKPWGMEWRPGRNFRNIADLYTKRNLWAQAAIMAAISREADRSIAEKLALGLTGSTLHLSKMSHHKEGGGGISVGTYYLPQLSKERYALKNVPDKLREVYAAQAQLMKVSAVPVCVSQQPFKTVSIPRDSVDYAFIDPPYAHKLQYGELNFVWESWLGFDGTWLDDEIVVNPFRHKSLDDWDHDMREVLCSLYAALKPGRWMSLCYHDTDPGTWARVQDMLLDSGFEIHTVTVLDPLQKSSNQLTAEKVAKGDLVVNCRKPRPGDTGTSSRDEAGLVSQRVREILVDALSEVSGQTRERLWDIVLKRLLARGELAEHRFDDLVSEVAFRSESGRWFLKDEFEGLSESDVNNEEQAGSGLTGFARLRIAGVPAALAAEIAIKAPKLATDEVDEGAVERYIRESLLKGRGHAEKFNLGGRMKGVEFYDCLFFYLTRWLKGRAGGKTPRRNLADFLDEYLVRFREGDKWLYRCPDEAEAQALKKARQTGLGRRIRQYVSFLNGEGDYAVERRPDVKTLCVWLKHCANFGIPEAGVALWEKGGIAAKLNELPEEQQYDAEDYYAQCRRRIQRASDEVEDADQDDSEEQE